MNATELLTSRLRRSPGATYPSQAEMPPGAPGPATPRWTVVLLVLLCAAAITVAIVLLGRPAASPTGYRLVTAGRGVVQSTVSGSGSLRTATTANVDFATSGRVTRIYVRKGDRVRRGQLLAQLDATVARLNLGAAQANLSAAETRLELAHSGGSSQSAPAGSQQGSSASAAQGSGGQAQGDAGAGSQESSPGSQQTTTPSSSQRTTTPSGATGSTQTTSPEAVEASVAAAQATVDSAAASVESARQALAATRLRAPTSGTVTSISGLVGSSVGAGGAAGNATTSESAGSAAPSSQGSATGASDGGGAAGGGAAGAASGSASGASSTSSAFIVITAPARLELQVPLSESDIRNVRTGQTATVTVNALPNEKLAAHVTSIGNISTTNNGVVSYPVTLRLDQAVPGLRPGMTGSAQIVVSQASGAVAVPSAAVSRRGGASVVTVVRGGRRVQQPVTTGTSGDSTTQIIGGLSPGDTVAIAVPRDLGGATGGSGANRQGGRGFGGGALGGGGEGGGAFGGGGHGGGGGGGGGG